MVRTIHQYLRKRVVVIASFLCVVILFAPLRAPQCQSRPEQNQRGKLDVVLMFDTSGSMLKTDPVGLRYEGAKLLISFLTEGDRLGVVQFAGDARILQELEPVSPSRKDRVMQRINSLRTEGTFTDITEGIKVSTAMLAQAGASDAQRVIVVLSDGKVEPDPAMGPAFARTLQLVQDMLPELKAKEMRVFTLALSDQADRALLGEVSAATDGLSWYAQTAEELHKIFAEMFLALKRPQVVPQTGRGFSLDAEVDEATFYINHAPEDSISLAPPQGDVMTAAKHPEYVTWFSGQNFDVITVTKPEAGNWRASGSVSDDGFATVLTNLRVITDWPLVIRAEDELRLQARLYEASKPVALPEISGVVKFSFHVVPTDKISKPLLDDVLYDDGSHGDLVATDGIFSARVEPLAVGDYKLTVEAKGPTFQRSQQIPFTVRPRLVQLSVATPQGVFAEELSGKEGSESSGARQEGADETARSRQHSGAEDTEFLVSISKEARYLKGFQLSLAALSEEKQVIDLPLRKVSPTGRDYVATANELRSNGTYQVKAMLRGRDKTGALVEAESSSVVFDFTSRKAAAPPARASEPERTKPREDMWQLIDRYQLQLTVLAVVSFVNIVGFFAARTVLKTRKRKSLQALGQRYTPPEQLLGSLESLEARAKDTAEFSEDSVIAIAESVTKEEPSDAATPAQGAEKTNISVESA